MCIQNMKLKERYHHAEFERIVTETASMIMNIYDIKSLLNEKALKHTNIYILKKYNIISLFINILTIPHRARFQS